MASAIAANTLALAPMLMLLAACDGGGGSGPGAVSEGEARALDEAAEMLDERRLPAGALPPVATQIPPDETAEEAIETE
ncbi:MAG: hypothetical protein ACX930_14285 [Erythrobacter sp.]